MKDKKGHIELITLLDSDYLGDDLKSQLFEKFAQRLYSQGYSKITFRKKPYYKTFDRTDLVYRGYSWHSKFKIMTYNDYVKVIAKTDFNAKLDDEGKELFIKE